MNSMETMDTMETLEGIIENIIFRNETNGWTVLTLVREDDGEEHTVVGALPACAPGESVSFMGGFVEHPSYGWQFKAISAEILAPASQQAVLRYLASGVIDGVGEKIAKRIVARFGMDTLRIMEEEPERLREVSGIGRATLGKITASFEAARATRATMLGLTEYGVTGAQAAKLFQRYGEGCLDRIRENPYQLIEEIEGFGFKTADAIARRAGFEHESRLRIRAGLHYTLTWAKQDAGHTYLPRAKLIEVASGVLSLPAEPIEDVLDRMILDASLVYTTIGEHDAVFLPALYYMEKDCARRLLSLAVRPADTPVLDIVGEIAYEERAAGVALAPLQRKAVETALNEGLMVITGGPGTGKTTILRFIIRILERLGMDFALAAPTGRAAKRMEEATGAEAKTIHRLLEYGGREEGAFIKNEDDPLFFDMIIVDEMSMVDIPLLHALLRAIPEGTQLVLVGDADQLPPVGPGNALRDIIGSGVAPVIRLTEIFRQSERGGIAENARLINLGRPPEPQPEGEFTFEECYTAEQAIARLLALSSHETGALGVREPLMDIQVLAPMKKGALGVKYLNAALQQALNPPAYDKPEKTFGDTIFRLGDKVMQIKNDYKLEWLRQSPKAPPQLGTGVFNGDMGTITRLDLSEGELEVVFDDGRAARYGFAELPELDLAYCISIHKSQGSEFPVILLPLLSGPPMLMTKNLLYTAVTRARQRVHILGRFETLAAMSRNESTRRRYSGLAEWLGRG